MSPRSILHLTGADAPDFLQGLVTNDVKGLEKGLVYAALLTPQGKYLADFFLVPHSDGILIDVASTLAPALMQRLRMYMLRADVALAETALHCHRGLSVTPDDAYPDPRHPKLGWRAYRDTPQEDDTTDWTAIRVALCIPETGQELTEDTYILEAGFERLNGVDFRKGCYVGQEVTARMKHKTTLRKGFARVSLSAPVSEGTPIEANGKTIGKIHSLSGLEAIAYLRFDRADGELTAGDATLSRLPH